MPKRHSLIKRFSWRLEYLGYRLVEITLTPLPLSFIDRLGSSCGFLCYYLSPYYRRLATRNLRIAFGQDKGLDEIRQHARATCQRTVANFLGTIKTTILPTDKVNQHVELQGREHLLNALAQGKGAVLVLGHMGNWEVLNRLHQFLPPNTPAGGIYQPLKNPLVNAHLLQRREQDGSQLFNKKKGFHGPASFVKNGGLLIVVADQKAGKAGTAIPFFGRLSSLSPLPALLARKADSPVLAAGIETIRPGRWRINFEPLPEQPQAPQIISALESLIRRSPADFLWLHNRWRPVSTTPLSLNSRKSTKTSATTTAMRVLFLVNGHPDIQGLQRYLAQRHHNDLPLACEFLIISEDETTITTTNYDLQQVIAPSQEQLAATISALDLNQKNPLEIVLIPSPSHLLENAAKLAKVPRIVSNLSKLNLEEFLQSLTRNFTKN